MAGALERPLGRGRFLDVEPSQNAVVRARIDEATKTEAARRGELVTVGSLDDLFQELNAGD
jgi:hypothetical protein